MTAPPTAVGQFRLEPPYTRDGGDPDRYVGVTALEHGPLLARTRGASRWHRVRSAVHYGPDWYMHRAKNLRLGTERTTLHYWCGSGGYAVIGDGTGPFADRTALTADTVPADEPLCGPCEGRAIGAGYPPVAVLATDTRLRFDPFSHYRIPPVCPGSTCRLLPDGTARYFPCPACGEITKARASSRGYRSDVNVERHEPGDGLVAPCPFHRWDALVLGPDGRAHCRCQPPEDPA